MRGSLAYRRNEAAILRGDVPKKYTRILPHVPEGSVIELGSAEGVLALLLAREGRRVAAVEASRERHEAALRLADRWGDSGVTFVRGDIREYLDQLGQFDVLVAVRSIYYLRNDIDKVFAAAAEQIPNVVLCGNRNRADAWRAGRPHTPLGDFNRYAASEGMTELLVRHGYEIVDEVTEGDEIVVGRRD